MRSPISRCVRSSTNRSRSTWRCARGSPRQETASVVRSSTSANCSSSAPIRSTSGAPSSSPGASSESVRYALAAASRLDHLLDGQAQRVAELGGGRRAPERRAQPLGRPRDPERPVLDRPRDVERPPAVAEVTLELAEDRRDREAREAGALGRVEAVDRLDQAERGDLHEVVERLVRVAVAAREAARERQEPLDELAADGGGARLRVLLEQRSLVYRRGMCAHQHQNRLPEGICS